MIQPVFRRAQCGDIEIHYAEWGTKSGQVVLLVHGNMRTSRSFDAVAKKIRICGKVIAVDLRGHGESTWTKTGYQFDDKARDLSNFSEHLNLEDVVAVGHSSGAVALIIASLINQNPFNRLILMEPMMVIDDQYNQLMAARAKKPRRTWSDPSELLELLQSHPTTRKWSPDVMKDVVSFETYINNCGRVDMKWSHQSLCYSPNKIDRLDVLPILNELHLPILIIISEENKNRFDSVTALAKNSDHISTVIIERTAHNMYMERPGTVANIIEAFSSDLPIPDRI